MRSFFLLFFITTLLFSKVNISLSHTNIKHGTTFAVMLQSNKDLIKAPNVIFKNKTYQMFTVNGNTKNYEVFIPVSYYSKRQKENIEVRYKQGNEVVSKKIYVKIVKGNYKKNEIIKVKKGKVKLSEKNKKKAQEEYIKVFKNVYSKITQVDLTKKQPFKMPIDSKITSAFGNARVYNGKTKSYHTGTDFRAKVGSKIKATNNGVIALTMDRFFLGKVVYIDHGRGAYSYYSHLSKIEVQKGQRVKRGQVIGRSGNTGRTTGPHLHYAFRLYNITVDPLQYMKLYNKILKK